MGHRACLSLLRTVKSFDGQVLRVEDTQTGEMMHETAFDSAMGSPYCAPRSHLQSELKALAQQGAPVARFHLVGCISARTAVEAVYEGHALGRAL